MVYLSKNEAEILIKNFSKNSNAKVKRIVKRLKYPEEKKIYAKEFSQIKKLLKRAFKEKRKVKIKDYSPHSDEHTTRIINIYQVHSDCVSSYCNLRKDERVFRINRINSAAILNEKYSIPKNWEPENIILNN